MLPKTAEYALRAVVWMASNSNCRASADTLARHTKVPRRYLNRVLQQLAQAGLVKSQSGPGGGYALAVAPGKVTILGVVNAVSPVERIRHCPLGLPSHTRLCPLHKELDRVYAELEKAFGRVTVAELLRSTTNIVPLCDVSR